MNSRDMLYAVSYSAFLLVNFWVFLKLAYYMMHLKNFKRRFKVLYKLMRLTCLGISVVSVWMTLVIWKTKFPLEVTELFKITFLVMILMLTGMGLLLYRYRVQVFEMLNSRYSSRV